VQTIAIVDYGMGNVRSVQKALEYVAPNDHCILTSDPQVIKNSDRIVFPGQGAMGACMSALSSNALTDEIKSASRAKPFLGSGIPGYRARIRPIVSRITIHWPSFYNVVTGKTLALPNLIALQHIPLSPAGVIAKRPAPIALPNSCAAEWRMAPDAVFSPYASVRYSHRIWCTLSTICSDAA